MRQHHIALNTAVLQVAELPPPLMQLLLPCCWSTVSTPHDAVITAARPLRSDACCRALRCHRDCRCSCPPRPLPLLLRRLVPPALLLPRRLPAPPRLRQVIPYPPRRCPERAPAPAPVPRRAPWQPRARRSTALHHAARPASHLPLNAVQRSRRRCCLSPPPPPSPLNLPR